VTFCFLKEVTVPQFDTIERLVDLRQNLEFSPGVNGRPMLLMSLGAPEGGLMVLTVLLRLDSGFEPHCVIVLGATEAL
jgi:hypothetical protein